MGEASERKRFDVSDTKWTPAVVPGEALVSRKGYKKTHPLDNIRWRAGYVESDSKQEYLGKIVISLAEHNVWWHKDQFIAQPV